jgi:hypothetical protein
MPATADMPVQMEQTSSPYTTNSPTVIVWIRVRCTQCSTLCSCLSGCCFLSASSRSCLRHKRERKQTTSQGMWWSSGLSNGSFALCMWLHLDTFYILGFPTNCSLSSDLVQSLFLRPRAIEVEPTEKERVKTKTYTSNTCGGRDVRSQFELRRCLRQWG